MKCTYEYALKRITLELPLLFKHKTASSWTIFNKNDPVLWQIFADHQNYEFFSDNSECRKSFFKILNNYTLYSKLALKNVSIDHCYNIYHHAYTEFNKSDIDVKDA
jgi:hypothetical protein